MRDAIDEAIIGALTAENERLETENARLREAALLAAAIGDWVCADSTEPFEAQYTPMSGECGRVRLDRLRHVRDAARKALGRLSDKENT